MNIDVIFSLPVRSVSASFLSPCPCVWTNACRTCVFTSDISSTARRPSWAAVPPVCQAGRWLTARSSSASMASRTTSSTSTSRGSCSFLAMTSASPGCVSCLTTRCGIRSARWGFYPRISYQYIISSGEKLFLVNCFYKRLDFHFNTTTWEMWDRFFLLFLIETQFFLRKLRVVHTYCDPACWYIRVYDDWWSAGSGRFFMIVFFVFFVGLLLDVLHCR